MTLLYQDEDLLLCLKPSGMLSLPKEGSREESALTVSASLCASPLFPVHRLDRPTAGLLLFAKNKASAAALSAAAAGDGMQKTYLAVAEGESESARGEMCDLLFFDRQKDKSFPVKNMRRGVKEARLSYAHLATADALSLYAVRLHTGRTHQIRAQFAARKMPLFGDARYGARTRAPLGLFAAVLSFSHPRTGAPMTFFAPPTGEGFLPFAELTDRANFKTDIVNTF